MKAIVRDHLYTECGLDFVTLRGITVFECTSCDETIMRIPAIDALHRTIAMAIIRKPSRLLPSEVKFLRKYLGLSNNDFASAMGVSAEQASRWTTTEPMSPSADRLLRLLVEKQPPAEEYPPLGIAETVKLLSGISDERDRVIPLNIAPHDASWEIQTAA